ncbi:MAG: hypothetical protein RL227_325 [Pseudomonadota bacterium]
MARNKKEQQAPRVIWRISQDHPEGVYLTTGGRPAERADSPMPDERGYRGSSHELQQGVDVTEAPLDALPQEWVDTPGRKRAPPDDSRGG